MKKVQNGQATVYLGAIYEKNLTTGVTTTYYLAGGQRLALRQGGTLYYLVMDHLGSTSLTLDANGNLIGEMKYYPYGETRYAGGSTPTDRRFTGQRQEDSSLGSLYDFNARFYSPGVMRFISADTIVPDPNNPQSLNRYTYGLDNPVKYTDPTGHIAACGVTAGGCDDPPVQPPIQPGGGGLLKVDPRGLVPTTIYTKLDLAGGVVIGAGGPGAAAQQTASWYLAWNFRSGEIDVLESSSLSGGLGGGAGGSVTADFAPIGFSNAPNLDSLEGTAYQLHTAFDVTVPPVLGADGKLGMNLSLAAAKDGTIPVDNNTRVPDYMLDLATGIGGALNPTAIKAYITLSVPTLSHPITWGTNMPAPLNYTRRLHIERYFAP